MKFDHSYTMKFLAAISNKDIDVVERENFTWILIPESTECKAKSPRPIQKYIALNKFYEVIMDANKSGYGVYVCINHTGCDYRTKKDVINIRAIYADFDKKLSEPLLWKEHFNTPEDAACFADNMDYPPDILVQSGNGYHMYWLLPLPLKATQEVQGQSELAMRGIAKHFSQYGADPAVAEISRVMRVPGTFNMKDPANPKLVRLIEHVSYEPPATSEEVLEQILLNYPPPPKVAQIKTTYTSNLEQEQKHTLATQWLRKKEPSIEGDGGSAKCMSAAWVGPGFDLDYDTALALLLEEFNPNCAPEWTIEELQHKLDDVYESATEAGKIGCYLPGFQHQLDLQALATGFAAEDASVAEEPETPLVQRSENEMDERLSLKTRSDYGMALRFKARNKDCFCSFEGHWYHFDGTKWSRNDSIAVVLMARNLKRVRENEVKYLDPELAPGHTHWAKSYEQTRNMDAALKQAKSLMARQEPFSVSHGALINFQNGALDLTSGTLLAHDPKHEFTYCLPHDFDPTATSPSWEKYLGTVFNEDREVIDYVQLLIGGTLISGTDHEFCVWLHGTGSNGKTTLTETLSYALGPLARQVPNDMFLVKRQGNSHPTEIAMLHGVKFATCDDISLNAKLEEGVFKRLVNTGKVTGRYMYKDFFEFQPTHKFWISVNNLPTVYDVSHGTWRRMIVIPFTRTFSADERDETLKQRLKQEVCGIWAWMARGALKFHQSGIPTEQPRAISDEISRWKQNENWFDNFKSECCTLDKGNQGCSVSSKQLYEEYCTWCRKTQVSPMSHKSFSTKVGSEFESYKSNGTMRFRGIKLQNDFDDYWGFGGISAP